MRRWILVGLFAALTYGSIRVPMRMFSSETPNLSRPIVLASNQARDDLSLLFQNTIQRAQKDVRLSIYSISCPKMIHTLNRSSLLLKNVHVHCDPNISKLGQKQLCSDIKITRHRGNGLMHRKLLIIDQQESWIGSANFTPDSLRIHGNLVAGVYDQNFTKHLINRREVPQKFIINHQLLEWWPLPNVDALDRVIETIRSAKKSIRIAMFTFTRIDLANEIVEAKKRGLHCKVVIDRNAGRGVGKKVVDYLKRNGVTVKLHEGPGLLHHKLLLTDSKTLLFGSANWTKAAFTQNRDCFIVLHELDKEQLAKIRRVWRVIRHESKEV